MLLYARSCRTLGHLAAAFAIGLGAAPAWGAGAECSAIFTPATAEARSEVASILVSRESQVTEYERTNRGVERLLSEAGIGYYTPEMLARSEFSGKRVLDAGCGDGLFVTELRADGVEAYGLDISLTPEQKMRPDVFVERDMTETGFASASIDRIYSTWSVFKYESKNLKLIERIAGEFERILVPGGIVRISPYFGYAMKPNEEALKAASIFESLGFATKLVPIRRKSDGYPILWALEAKRLF